VGELVNGNAVDGLFTRQPRSALHSRGAAPAPCRSSS
jgi:hypothetical protein